MSNDVSLRSPARQFLSETLSVQKPVSITQDASGNYHYSKSQLALRCALAAIVATSATFALWGAFGATLVIPMAYFFSKFVNNENVKIRVEIQALQLVDSLYKPDVDPAQFDNIIKSKEMFARYVADPRFNCQSLTTKLLVTRLFENMVTSLPGDKERGSLFVNTHLLMDKGVRLDATQLTILSIMDGNFPNQSIVKIVDCLRNDPDLIATFSEKELAYLVSICVRQCNELPRDILPRLISMIEAKEETQKLFDKIIKDCYVDLKDKTSIRNLILLGRLDINKYEAFASFNDQEMAETVQNALKDRENPLNTLPVASSAPTYSTPAPFNFFVPAVEIYSSHYKVSEASLLLRAYLVGASAFLLMHSVAALPVTLGTLAAVAGVSLLGYAVEKRRAVTALFKTATEEIAQFNPSERALNFYAKNLRAFATLSTSQKRQHNEKLLEALLKYEILEDKNVGRLAMSLMPEFLAIMDATKDNFNDRKKIRYLQLVIDSGLWPLLRVLLDAYMTELPAMTDQQQHDCWMAAKNADTIALLAKKGFNPNVVDSNGKSVLQSIYNQGGFLRSLKRYSSDFTAHTFAKAMLDVGANPVVVTTDGKENSTRQGISMLLAQRGATGSSTDQ
jgi:hypothetical protein